MKIVLNRSGGLTGKLLFAEAEWELPDQEYEKLLLTIKRKKIPRKERKVDAFTYTLHVSGDDESSTVIDPNKIPEDYHAFFKPLFESLSVKKKSNHH